MINNASTRFGYIERAMDSLPEAKKYDVEALLEKARSDVEDIAKIKVDASAAKTIANKLTVKHIIEYIIHIKQQEEDNEQKQQQAQIHRKKKKLRRIHRKRAEAPRQG